MNKKKINPLIVASVTYFFSTVIGQGMTFLGIIVFTRLMSQKDYGNYSTYYAYVSLLTVLVGANLYYSINNAYIDFKDRIYEFRKSVLTLSSLIMLMILGILLSINYTVGVNIKPILILCIVLHSYGFFLINYKMYSANMENSYISKSILMSVPFIMQFLISFIAVFYCKKSAFESRVIGSSMGIFICGLVVVYGIIKVKGKFINLSDWKYALKISVPSIIMSISYMLMQQCDKVMVTKFCGAEETAIYAVMYYFGYAVIAVDQSVSAVRQSWIFKKLDQKKMDKTKLIQKWYLLAIAVIVSLIYMVAPEVIRIIVPNSYWKYNYIAPFIVGACMMILYKFYVELALFYKKNFLMSIYVLISAVVNLFLNTIFISQFGAVAACYTTVVSYFILFLLSRSSVNNEIKSIYSNSYFVVFICCIITNSIIFQLTVEKICLRYVIYMIFILSEVVYFYKKRSEWKEIVMK